MTDHGEAEQALVACPGLRRLRELRESGGWFFQPVLVASELELLVGARVWPQGWSDTIAIRDVGDARGFRCDPDGGEVWQRAGGLVEVIDGLLELPAPDQPGAPRLVKAKTARLWTPGDTSRPVR
jgi:hypothetical protein